MFSVLNDSSTDICYEELVSVRYLEDGRPVTKFLSIQALAKMQKLLALLQQDKTR